MVNPKFYNIILYMAGYFLPINTRVFWARRQVEILWYVWIWTTLYISTVTKGKPITILIWQELHVVARVLKSSFTQAEDIQDCHIPHKGPEGNNILGFWHCVNPWVLRLLVVLMYFTVLSEPASKMKEENAKECHCCTCWKIVGPVLCCSYIVWCCPAQGPL